MNTNGTMYGVSPYENAGGIVTGGNPNGFIDANAKREFFGNTALARGESVIKSYAAFKGAGGKGSIAVTNKRLICDFELKTQVDIDKVECISSYKSTEFKFFKFIFAMLFVGAAVAMCVLPFEKWINNLPSWWKILTYVAAGGCGLVGLLLLFTCVKKHFFIDIKTSAMSSAITLGRGTNFSDAGIKIYPTKQTKKMIANLGALILEIKESRGY